MQCPKCSAQNRDGRRFCGGCGAPLGILCPNCGFTNDPDERFCGGCGAPLGDRTTTSPSPVTYTPEHLAERILHSRSALEGERKQVTVLFADIKASTELIEGLDPEQAAQRLEPALQTMMDAVHRYEGTVNKVQGDGVMALFGAPLAHEDHAVRAGYAALAMRDAIKEGIGGDIHVRIGLHSGEVVVRSIGTDLSMAYDAVGATVHLASRMEQLASPDTVLMTTDTHRLDLDEPARANQTHVATIGSHTIAFSRVSTSRPDNTPARIIRPMPFPFDARASAASKPHKSKHANEAF